MWQAWRFNHARAPWPSRSLLVGGAAQESSGWEAGAAETTRSQGRWTNARPERQRLAGLSRPRPLRRNPFVCETKKLQYPLNVGPVAIPIVAVRGVLDEAVAAGAVTGACWSGWQCAESDGRPPQRSRPPPAPVGRAHSLVFTPASRTRGSAHEATGSLQVTASSADAAAAASSSRRGSAHLMLAVDVSQLLCGAPEDRGRGVTHDHFASDREFRGPDSGRSLGLLQSSQDSTGSPCSHIWFPGPLWLGGGGPGLRVPPRDAGVLPKAYRYPWPRLTSCLTERV